MRSARGACQAVGPGHLKPMGVDLVRLNPLGVDLVRLNPMGVDLVRLDLVGEDAELARVLVPLPLILPLCMKCRSFVRHICKQNMPDECLSPKSTRCCRPN